MESCRLCRPRTWGAGLGAARTRGECFTLWPGVEEEGELGQRREERNPGVASGRQQRTRMGGRQEVRQTYTLLGCSFLVSVKKWNTRVLARSPPMQA